MANSTKEQIIRETIIREQQKRAIREENYRKSEENAKKAANKVDYAEMASPALFHLKDIYEFSLEASRSETAGADRERYAKEAKALKAGIESINALISLETLCHAIPEKQFTREHMQIIIRDRLKTIFEN